jgi:hypothetical protein
MAASRVDGPNGGNVVTKADSPPPPVIKIYVITDATTAFVLRVLIYTGKTTYYNDSDAVCGILRSGEQTRIESCIIHDSRIHG